MQAGGNLSIVADFDNAASMRAELRIAEQTILHNREHQSRVVLPLVR